jgi:hypothetical protein
LFDYERWLDFLVGHGMNYMRMWTWEHPYGMQFTDRDIRYYPQWYERTGPGVAADGGAKFDLHRLSPYLMQRLRHRVRRAAERGIYVGVMLFQGFSVDKTANSWRGKNAYVYHPMNRANNVNDIDADSEGTGTGHGVHRLGNRSITDIHEARVRAIVGELNDCDNLLWEIGNELAAGSVEWQYHMIELIRGVEGEMANRHPIGMSGAPIRNQALLESPADWVGPCHEGGPAGFVPEDYEGRKVVIADTDHLGYAVSDPLWPWKCLLSGHHFCIMDPYMDARFGSPRSPMVEWDGIRAQTGLARRTLASLPIEKMTPDPAATEGADYCLSERGECYIALVDRAAGASGDVDEAGSRATRVTIAGVRPNVDYRISWLNLKSGRWGEPAVVRSDTNRLEFTAPSGNAASKRGATPIVLVEAATRGSARFS